MNFRSRLLVWGLVIGCLPLLVLASLARVEGRTALDQSQAIRLSGHVDRLRALVLDDELRLETGVDALRSLILDTPEIRAAVVASGGTGEIPTVHREMA